MAELNKKFEDDPGERAKWLPADVSLRRVELEKKIYGFSQLEQNWDSYDAEKVTPEAIQMAHEVLKGMIPDTSIPQTDVFSMRDGGIQFEIGEDLEIEIDPKGIKIEITNFGSYGKILNTTIIGKNKMTAEEEKKKRIKEFEDALIPYERDAVKATLDALGVPEWVDIDGHMHNALMARIHWLAKDYERLKNIFSFPLTPDDVFPFKDEITPEV